MPDNYPRFADEMPVPYQMRELPKLQPDTKDLLAALARCKPLSLKEIRFTKREIDEGKSLGGTAVWDGDELVLWFDS